MVKEDRERKRQQREQDVMKSEQAEKKKKLFSYSSFIEFLRNNNLRETNIILGQSRFNLFNGRQFAEILERHHNEIVEILKDYYDDESEALEGKKRVNLVNFLIQEHIIVKVEQTVQKSKIKTITDMYTASKQQQVEEDSQIISGFFVFNPHIKVQSKKNYVYMILILIGIALIILFPVWPISIKKLIFYISVVMLFVLLGLILVRTFLYFLVRIFGFDFYIFPNLFADVGFLDSFKPIIQLDQCNDSKLELLFRFVGFFIMGYVIYILSIERHSVKQFSTATFDDIIDWGYQKLEYVQPEAPHNSILHEIEKEDLEERLKQQNQNQEQHGTQFDEPQNDEQHGTQFDEPQNNDN
ncbi:translocation protein Sec62, putative (macronuclear) [Tetrahymena thermophila SB210]|uniref:Translocation protein SEC62 n=1 Tax=Tetrahymena thermophila (strain SB210) TaxID=312017 RepID=Q23TF2_TETTS|nr:translocation protein Sec62, putative [Tetrahymena thermophila SB210]EAR99754.1 translocation protein Sec62, putative [Tetrahymena thermophila SB210]|eukprot:XP_001019999.1 translocation protein Sec62, putative [Tetrahymena thermophila SB210]